MGETLTVQSLLDYMVDSAESLGYKRPEHPTNDLFLNALKYDLVDASKTFQSNRMKPLNLSEAKKIISEMDGKIGNRTSVDLEVLGRDIMQDLQRPSSALGEKLGSAKPKKDVIAKADFMEVAREVLPNIASHEMDDLEKNLPEELLSEQDVHDAIYKIDPDYWGDLEDVPEKFNEIKTSLKGPL